MDTTEEVRFGIRLPVYGKFPVANPFDLIRRLARRNGTISPS
jgi:hypothetical protein